MTSHRKRHTAIKRPHRRTQEKVCDVLSDKGSGRTNGRIRTFWRLAGAYVYV